MRKTNGDQDVARRSDVELPTSLPLSTGFFQSLLDQLVEGVYFVDGSRRILYWNEAAERLTGYRAQEVVGHHCFDNILDHTDQNGCQLCHSKCPLAVTLKRGVSTHSRVFLRHKDGRRVAVDVKVSPIRDESGRILGGVEIFHDASEAIALEQAYATMREISLKDPLTGLSNRRHLDAMIAMQLGLLSRTGLSVSVVMADIDHFKDVNDSWGHAVGDFVLQRFATTLQLTCRHTDILGRYGGEEFLIIAPGLTLSEAVRLAERVRVQVEACVAPGELRGRAVTCSLGVAEAHRDDTTDSLLKRVDEALYRAKQQGRNQVVTERTQHATSDLEGSSPRQGHPAAKITSRDSPSAPAMEAPRFHDLGGITS